MTTAEDRLRQEAMGMSALSSRGVEDITEEFTTASDQLEPGELVKDEWFTLFEAVGALEVCLNLSLPISHSISPPN